MVNYKKKAGKKTKTASGKKRSASRTPSSTVSGHVRIPVVTSLPPAVDGHLRCFLRVSIPTIHWTIPKYPTDVQVRLRWWGEDGDGVLFRPLDDREADQTKHYPSLTCVRYAVCSGPRQFIAYLQDMGALIFEVVHGPLLMLLGQVRLIDTLQLSASAPIQGFFDVMSTSSPGEKLALLYIALKFESLSAAYSELSSSMPTVDMETVLETEPASLNPGAPVIYPRQESHDVDPFVSLASKGVKFAPTSPEKLEYTAENSQKSTPTTERKELKKGLEREMGVDEGISRSELTSVRSPHHEYKAVNISSDLIGALLHRGEKLREAMVMSADEDNSMEGPEGMHTLRKGNSPPGKLLKAILTSDEHGLHVDESGVIDSAFSRNNEVVDLVLGEEEMHYLEESPHSSPENSVASGDPLYDETLLKDLFYTTLAMQSDADSENTIVTDDEESVTNSPQEEKYNKVSFKVRQKHRPAQTISTKGSSRQDKTVNHVEQSENNLTTDDSNEGASMEYDDPNSTDNATGHHRGKQSPSHHLSDLIPSAPKSKILSPNSHTFIEDLGPEKLTALGRVDTARVMVDSLGITSQNSNPGTYFVEYNFPTSTPSYNEETDINMATESTRIASKNIQDGTLLFNHRSVFPVLFNSAVIEHWWSLPLTFTLYFRESGQRVPAIVGIAVLPLKKVLQSDTLSSSASLQIKYDLHFKHEESSGSCGPLLVKVQLMMNGKELHVKPKMLRKPPLPTLMAPARTTDLIQVSKPHPVGQVYDVSPLGRTETANQLDKQLPQTGKQIDLTIEQDPLTLYNLLWIPEGKALFQHGHHSSQDVPMGLVTKSNLYLVCRMFWCEEVSKSRVCWGTVNPPFGFKQVAPVILTSTLLQRVCNNFMVVEVWNRVGPNDLGDKLLGLVKLPLHQLYLSYRDPKITKTLLKSKFPVVAVDHWCPVTDPFTHMQHGHIRVLLAMGIEQQIGAILSIKCGGEIPVGVEPHSDHHLDSGSGRIRDGKESENSHLARGQELVEHQFEIVVEDIKGLSVFGNTVWGETDCFVQYHFPFQRHLESDYAPSEGMPSLQPHRTPTTLCVPEPAFHDVTRHTLKLAQGFPVQKLLLAAFTGSWLAAPTVPGSGGVPFELWQRYYYPNIRDQMVAKTSLPLAKLCAMVTMQKQGEANVQTFSLPLRVLAGNEVDNMRQDKVRDTGLLDITIKYQQVKPEDPIGRCTAQMKDNNQVCLSLKVFQACGLKAAALLHAESNPSLSYPAEVGVNTYIVLRFPLGKKYKHVTRTVARTFSPEFSYSADILLPIVLPADASGTKRNLSLAEQLEKSEMVFEVWHQMSRGVSGDQTIRSGMEQVKSGRQSDVLLGMGKVPLFKLLAHKTGVKGWYPIYLPSKSDMHDGDVDKAVGGLELSIKFSEADDRDHIIHLSRGVGWSPLPEIVCDEVWLDKEDLSKKAHWEVYLNISKAWIPSSELHFFHVSATKLDKNVRAYARYKLYNKAPICSSVSSVKDSGDGKFICELKHCIDVVLPASPSLTWQMKEECLEVQLWLRNKRSAELKDHKKRDRLVGSAFVDVSSLLQGQQRKNRQISGLYPLFRSGASDLCGAYIHVQVTLNLSSDDAGDHQLDLEGQLSSHESASGSSSVEDHVQDSRSMISTQVHTMPVKLTQHETNKQLPVTEADDNTFMAHVIIEQALHLPTVPGVNDARLMPNVYVSYQTLASLPLASTPVVKSSCSPKWEYQKLERISYSSLKSQDLVFKVWHTPETHKKGEPTETPESAGRKEDNFAVEHRVIGFVSFDLSPLLAGMRQLIGWYNVTDFNGDCQGQIKLGVSPVNPVSPSRCFPLSRTTNVHSPKQDAALIASFQISHRTNDSDHRLQINHPLSSQLEEHHKEDLISFRPYSHDSIGQEADREIEAPSVSSTSLLFSQLRHNMKELDALRRSLNVKLLSSNSRSDPGNIQEQCPVILPPHCHFAGSDATEGNKPLKPLGTVEVPDMEHKPPESNEKNMVSNDGRKLLPLISSLETEQALDSVDHKQNTKRTIDTVVDNGAGAFNSNNSLPFKRKDESLQHDPIEDGSFSSEKLRSLPEEQQPCVDSELSVSDISRDLSLSGYVKDNTKSARYADLKDSWLSSEEEDNAESSQSENPDLTSGLSAFNMESVNNAVDANNVRCHDKGNHDDNGDEDCVMPSHVDRDQSLEHSTGNHDFGVGTTVVGSASGACAAFITSESDYEHENSSFNALDSRKWPKQALLSSHHTSFKQTSAATLPNFFIPSEELEESMRALRLGSSTKCSPSKLLAHSEHLKTHQQTTQNVTEKFAKRQTVYKERKDGKPPISDSEVDRIARIFSFNFESESQTKSS